MTVGWTRASRPRRPAVSGAGAMAAFVAVALLATSLARQGWAAPRGGRRLSARGYADAAKRWHTVAEGERAELDEVGRPKLVLHALNTGEKIALPALRDDGGFDAASLERAAHLLRDQRTGKRHPVHPGVLELLYRAQRSFDAPLVRVISGYRAPKGKGHSNHGRGRAIDIVLPGVTDDALAGWARAQGFVGVGIYPVGKFCHVDVRPQSYFWRDTSGPGGRSREQPLRGRGATSAAAMDEAARKQGGAPFATYREPEKSIESVWKASPKPAVAPTSEPDDEHGEGHETEEAP